MLATFISLAVISFAIAALRELARQDGAKIVAALHGRSWAAELRPEQCSISSRRRAVGPPRQALRAAA